MREIKICSVTDRYITYLREKHPDVYSNKEDKRTHTRKHIGAVLYMKGFNYYVPMSSPKESDYQIASAGKVIKKSIVPIMRITVKNINGETENEWRYISGLCQNSAGFHGTGRNVLTV